MKMLSRLTLALVLTSSSAFGTQQVDAPKVTATSPKHQARDVKSGPAVIRIEFDRPMRKDAYGMSVWPGFSTPEPTGPIRFSSDGRVYEIPVNLKPRSLYAFDIDGFRGMDGTPVIKYRLFFTTVD